MNLGMKWLRFLAVYALAAAPALGDTLLKGAIYFDSQNTMLEVADMLKTGDTNGLATLFKGNHISEKLPKDLEIILLSTGPDPASPVEFRFAHEPTTYWTYARYVAKTDTNLSPALPFSSSDLAPTALNPSPTPATPPPSPPRPSPSPSPSPRPKTPVAGLGDPVEGDTGNRPPLRKRHPRPTPPSSEEDGVPESAKVWHRVNGHLKWYDKRNLHEVRRALPVEPNLPTATAVTPRPAQ